MFFHLEKEKGFLESDRLKVSLSEQVSRGMHEIKQMVSNLHQQNIDKLFLLGSGGSLAVAYPLEMLIEKYTSTYQCKSYNGEDFLCRRPQIVDSRSGVIGISYSGNTTEIIEGLKWAKKRGALIIALTAYPQAPIASDVDGLIEFDPEVINISKMYLLYFFFSHLVEPINSLLSKQLQQNLMTLPDKIHRYKERVLEELKETAHFLDNPNTFGYVIGAGLTYGVAYNFAYCNLMEMLWTDASLIHAGDFRHGPLEIVSPDKNFIFFLGEEPSRKVVERARKFVSQYTKNVVVLDIVDAIIDQPDFSPFYAHVAAYALTYHLARRRERSLEIRRYYGGKVEYPE